MHYCRWRSRRGLLLSLFSFPFSSPLLASVGQSNTVCLDCLHRIFGYSQFFFASSSQIMTELEALPRAMFPLSLSPECHQSCRLLFLQLGWISQGDSLR